MADEAGAPAPAPAVEAPSPEAPAPAPEGKPQAAPAAKPQTARERAKAALAKAGPPEPKPEPDSGANGVDKPPAPVEQSDSEADTDPGKADAKEPDGKPTLQERIALRKQKQRVAARERELQRREKDLEERDSLTKKEREELDGLKKRNPVEYLRRHGFSLREIAELESRQVMEGKEKRDKSPAEPSETEQALRAELDEMKAWRKQFEEERAQTTRETMIRREYDEIRGALKDTSWETHPELHANMELYGEDTVLAAAFQAQAMHLRDFGEGATRDDRLAWDAILDTMEANQREYNSRREEIRRRRSSNGSAKAGPPRTGNGAARTAKPGDSTVTARLGAGPGGDSAPAGTSRNDARARAMAALRAAKEGPN